MNKIVAIFFLIFCTSQSYAECMWSWIGNTYLGTVGKAPLGVSDSEGDTTWVNNNLTFDTSRDGTALFFGHVGNYGTISIGEKSLKLPRDGYPHRYPYGWQGGENNYGYTYMVGRNSKKMVIYKMLGSDDPRIYGKHKYQLQGGQACSWVCDGPWMTVQGDFGNTPMHASITGAGVSIWSDTISRNRISMTSINNWPIAMWLNLLLPDADFSITPNSPNSSGAATLNWGKGSLKGVQKSGVGTAG
jgi:hypothetical protein